MIKDFEILCDTDLKSLEAKVKRRLSDWQPVGNIVVIPKNKNYNEFSLMVAELDKSNNSLTELLDYQIIVENDIKRLEAQIKRAHLAGFMPIENFIVIENFNGYNQFAIQIAKFDQDVDFNDIYDQLMP